MIRYLVMNGHAPFEPTDALITSGNCLCWWKKNADGTESQGIARAGEFFLHPETLKTPEFQSRLMNSLTAEEQAAALARRSSVLV
jgi:hypothetical protein